MKEIRKNVLGKKDFEMFLIAEEAKNNNKKMKFLFDGPIAILAIFLAQHLRQIPFSIQV